jgi:hypothetical protein
MTSYFPLRPMSEGTEDIEHFHSFFYRFAKLHSTTMTPMAKHLQAWWNRTHSSDANLRVVFLYKASGLPLCGYGDAVERYVKVVSEAAHCPELYRTTLMPLRTAGDKGARTALRQGRAWCPACMYWAHKRGETHYDKLIWAIAMTARCPIHQVSIVNECPHCGARQQTYSKEGMAFCDKCLGSLLQEPKSWQRNTRPAFGEKDCIGLVRAIADGTLRNSVPRAFRIFLGESFSLAKHDFTHGFYELRNSEIRKSRRPNAPTLSTMIKRCYVGGVSLVNLLTDPKGAAHAAGQLIEGDASLPSVLRPRRSEELLVEARRRLNEALLGLPKQQLVSFQEFARLLGVSTGYLLYREPVLSKVYIENFKRQLRIENKRRKREAEKELTLGGAFLRYLSGDYRSQDELVDHLNHYCGVQKRVARMLISEMQKTDLRVDGLSKKLKPTVSKRTLLKRDIKDGCSFVKE